MLVKYIQPIFAPNQEMADKNLISLRSFFEYYLSQEYSFKCIFGGYAASDLLWGQIESFIKSQAQDSVICRFDKNYGKAYVVNNLVSKYIGDSEYFLTADSDIIFKMDEIDLIDRLIEAIEHAKEKNLNPALISLYQEENNCQILPLCYENTYYYEGRYQTEMYCHPNGDGGVAGGCLFISTEFWRKVKGYQVLGVYAADDANLMRDAYLNGYKFLMSNSIRCIHPFDTDQEYCKWKLKVCPKSQDLNLAMQEADVFWKSPN